MNNNYTIEYRSIHELLTILRDNASVENGLIQSGLCCDVEQLLNSNIFTIVEAWTLLNYIKKYMPIYVIPERFVNYKNYSNGFGWLPRKWKPRLKWLNEHIELTRSK
jgi:hypothetical protein